MEFAIKNGIKDEELAAFLAQCAHESLNFTRLEERGSDEYFNQYDINHNPKKAKLLGNTEPGDGYRYRGRGIMQLTGRYNYRMVGEALGIDLEKHPEKASDPKTSAEIAVWFWKKRVQPNVEDYTDTADVTSMINKGLHGLEQRKTLFQKFTDAITGKNTEDEKAEKSAAKKPGEKPAEKPAQKSTEKPAAKKPVEKTAEKPVAKPVAKPAAKSPAKDEKVQKPPVKKTTK